MGEKREAPVVHDQIPILPSCCILPGMHAAWALLNREMGEVFKVGFYDMSLWYCRV